MFLNEVFANQKPINRLFPNEERYYSMPTPPGDITAENIICRLLAGIGFRFYWATEGLGVETYAFEPCEGARSIGETIEQFGQIATLRRVAGSPVPDSNPFEGTPAPGR